MIRIIYMYIVSLYIISQLVIFEFFLQVAQLSKFREGGGLGISLEGTVDVEDGKEVRPHHYIRSILPDGPVGVNGKLQGGDELLEVKINFCVNPSQADILVHFYHKIKPNFLQNLKQNFCSKNISYNLYKKYLCLLYKYVYLN